MGVDKIKEIVLCVICEDTGPGWRLGLPLRPLAHVRAVRGEVLHVGVGFDYPEPLRPGKRQQAAGREGLLEILHHRHIETQDSVQIVDPPLFIYLHKEDHMVIPYDGLTRRSGRTLAPHRTLTLSIGDEDDPALQALKHRILAEVPDVLFTEVRYVF